MSRESPYLSGRYFDDYYRTCCVCGNCVARSPFKSPLDGRSLSARHSGDSYPCPGSDVPWADQLPFVGHRSHPVHDWSDSGLQWHRRERLVIANARRQKRAA